MLVFGGLNSADAPQKIIQEYTPASDSWSQLATELPEPMYGMAHATIESEFYMTTGQGPLSTNTQATLLRFTYDGGWTALGEVIPNQAPGSFCLVATNLENRIASPEQFTLPGDPLPELGYCQFFFQCHLDYCKEQEGFLQTTKTDSSN